MPFTIQLDLRDTDTSPADRPLLYVRPSRLLLDDDPTGAVIFTEDVKQYALPTAGATVISAQVAALEDFGGAAWYGVCWTGHMDEPVWIPAQANGETTTVRRWIDDPQVVPPPVASLPGIYERLTELEAQLAELLNPPGPTVIPDPAHAGYFTGATPHPSHPGYFTTAGFTPDPAHPGYFTIGA